MSLFDTLLDTPESATNRPAALRRALKEANKGGWDNHRARCLSTKSRFLLWVIALALVFTAGYVAGMKATNDYYEETNNGSE